MFDKDDDGALTRRELWKFLRAFLTALFAFAGFRTLSGGSSRTQHLRNVVIELVDDTAVEATQRIFTALADPAAVTFDDFGEWYNSGGFNVLPWLELLDLKKWPKNVELDAELSSAQKPVPAVAPPVSGVSVKPPPGLPPRPVGASAVSAALPGAVKGLKPPAAPANAPIPPQPPALGKQSSTSSVDALTDAPALMFKLSNECVPLVLSQIDVRRFLDFLVASGLCDVRPKTIIRELLKVEVDGTITPQAFLRAIDALVPADSLDASFSRQSQHSVKSALQAFFGSFDLYGGEVDAPEFMAGALLLSSGTKSDKLGVAYSLFDTTGNGKLSRRALWKFLRSFLTALASLSTECANMDERELQQLIDSGAVEVTADVFLKAEREDKDMVSFDEFGQWYNSGGYQHAPWLELLDHSKWIPRTSNAASASASPAPSPAAATPKESEASGTVLLQFPQNPTEADSPTLLLFTVSDCAKLSQVLALTRLNSIDPEYMHTLFNTQTQDGLLTKGGFDHCIRQLVPGSSLNRTQRGYLTVALSTLFFAFGGVGEGDRVQFNEFSTGFSILAAGSKSEKLSLAFRLFDDDEDGCLNRKQVRLMCCFVARCCAL